MKKLLLCFLVSASLIACTNQETKTETVDANIALFKENSKVVQKAFDSFIINDLNAWSELFADTAKFNSPVLGDTSSNKAASRKNLVGFHSITKEFKITKVVYLPTVDTLTFKPDGGVRSLVEWNMVLLNGDKVDMKYYAYFKFNSDHKIVSANEFFDAGSYIKLASEAAEKVKK
ncbi:nuclear transport factor 2 family protein [Flavobacterium sp.]|uniref:nuclear transport factor 2 family protein n=1 Tax=Flavobacterium sp. TaxID=239 RepID=UPI0038FCBFA3